MVPWALADDLRALPDDDIDAILSDLTNEERASLLFAWDEFWLRPDARDAHSIVGAGQKPPPGRWIWWVNQGGRGSGKSLACSWEFTKEAHRLGPAFVGIILAQTVEEARKLIEGASGVLTISPPWMLPKWNPAIGDGLLTWPSGAIAHVYSADKPAKGRGPNFNRWLIDDPPAFGPNGKKLFDALARAFRRQGHGLRAYIATTPPGDPPPTCPDLLEFVLAGQFDAANAGGWIYSITSSDENMGNLDEDTKRVLAMYAGTVFDEAERKGVYDPKATARVFAGVDFTVPPIAVAVAPSLRWAAVWIDPALSSGVKPCEVGIVAVGQGHDGRGVVLEDASGHYTDREWPGAALDLLERWERLAPSHLGVETNKTEAHAETLLSMAIDLRRQTALAEKRAPRPHVRIVTVHTNKRKAERAGLLVAYYRAGNIQHAPGLIVAEKQLASLSDARKQGPGYDRADALVYGLLDVFGLLDKVRPGRVGQPPSDLSAGAFGSSERGSLNVSRPPLSMVMQEPAGPSPGAFGQSRW